MALAHITVSLSMEHLLDLPVGRKTNSSSACCSGVFAILVLEVVILTVVVVQSS